MIFFEEKKQKKTTFKKCIFSLVVSCFFIGVGSSSTLFSRKSSVDFCCRDAVGKPKGYVQKKLAKPDTFATRMSCWKLGSKDQWVLAPVYPCF